MRAADSRDSARFSSTFLALGFSRFDGESSPALLPLPITCSVKG